MAAISDIFSLQFRSTIRGGVLVANTFHVRQNPTAGGVDAAHLTALLADANTTTLITKYRDLLTTADTLDAVVARQVPDPLFPADPRAEAARAVGSAGTRSNANYACDQALCAVVTLGTDLAGRRYRGRFFVPPVLEDQLQNGGQFNTAGSYWTGLTGFLTELAKTMYPAGAGHYGGAWNDNDLCVYSMTARRVDASPYYARVVAATRINKQHWLRSRTPSV